MLERLSIAILAAALACPLLTQSSSAQIAGSLSTSLTRILFTI
jgi:hypothetical protein